jgi:hypothetical protein
MSRSAPAASRLPVAALCTLVACLGLGIFQTASAASEGNAPPSGDALRQQPVDSVNAALSRMEESGPLAAIKSMYGHCLSNEAKTKHLRSGRLVLKRAQSEYDPSLARLATLEACLAKHPVVAACLSDGSHAGATERQLDGLATQLRAAMDRACAAPDGDEARARVAEAR